jgi:co-chaperonin GroES (HSP10)
MSDIDVDKTVSEAERKAKQLPDPVGFKLLCMVPKIEDTFGDSKIVKSEDTVRVEEQTTIVLFVAKVGPDAYADKTRFPNGPWCKVGDFVVVRAYSGTRLKIHGTEWRIINDDSVDGTVEDPRGIGRAG